MSGFLYADVLHTQDMGLVDYKVEYGHIGNEYQAYKAGFARNMGFDFEEKDYGKFFFSCFMFLVTSRK